MLEPQKNPCYIPHTVLRYSFLRGGIGLRILPFEPDPDHTGVGIGSTFGLGLLF